MTYRDLAKIFAVVYAAMMLHDCSRYFIEDAIRARTSARESAAMSKILETSGCIMANYNGPAQWYCPIGEW